MYSWREVQTTKDKNQQWQGTIAAPAKDKPNTIGTVTWKFMTVAVSK
jgi:alpha-D-xyloside xylohydrolase